MVGSAGPQRTVTRSAPRSRISAQSPARASTSALPFTEPQPAEGPPALPVGVEAGLGSFVTPPPMEVDKTYVLEFAVGADEASIRAETQGRGLEAPERILIAQGMRVKLLDNPAFKINARSKSEQDLGLDKTGTWLWDVTPLVGGKQSLQAEVEIVALNPDGSFGRTLDTSKRWVEVTVTVGGMKRAIGAIDDASTIGEKLTGLFGTWQKTIGALVALLGAIGLLAWKLGLRRAKPAE